MKKSSTKVSGNLEELFQHQFGEAEVQPRANLWNRIDEQLELQEARHMQARFGNFKRLAAACAALLLCFSLYAMYEWNLLGLRGHAPEPAPVNHPESSSPAGQSSRSLPEATVELNTPAPAAPALSAPAAPREEQTSRPRGKPGTPPGGTGHCSRGYRSAAC